jgi:hypothetical protein
MRHPSRLSLFAVLTVLTLLAGCGRDATSPVAPSGNSSASLARVQGLATAVRADIAHAIDVQNRATPGLLQQTGVIGSGTSVDEQGRPVVLVYTDRPGVSGIAATLEDVPTRVMMVGKVIAYSKPVRNAHGGSGTVQMGTSTGNDLECSAGTLSCVVTKSGTEYFLSNNHVFARENAASIGERIDAPGRYDGKPRCSQTPEVGTLADFRNVSFSSSNVVDCAITKPAVGVAYSKVEAGGYQPATATQTASIGLACKKTGRTSGLTTGAVQAINVTIQVQYTSGIATFTNQIQFPGTFIRSGDSGSLAVTQSGNNPVALMFAGGSGGSFGNPIGSVLSALGVSIAP